MSTALQTDPRGIILPCPHCRTDNRVGFARLGQQGRCGSCRASLPPIGEPVEIRGADDFAALMAQSPLPVVIDFWAPWCGPCRSMAPEFSKAASQAAGEAVFVKVNTEEHQGISSQFRIQGIPAFVLIRQGRLVSQTSGFQSAARLLAWLRSA